MLTSNSLGIIGNRKSVCGGMIMKKKLFIGILSAALLISGASAAFATTDSSKLAEIKDLYTQMFNIQKQIVDKQVEAGTITQDQANTMKDAIDQRAQYNSQAIDNGQAFGPGFGGRMGGYGCGGYGYNQQGAKQNGTWGPGQGMGMRGRWGGSQTPATTPAPAPTNFNN
jgi:hypothetical protein